LIVQLFFCFFFHFQADEICSPSTQILQFCLEKSPDNRLWGFEDIKDINIRILILILNWKTETTKKLLEKVLIKCSTRKILDF